MVTCENCHKHLPAADRFCVYCGTRQPFRLPWLGRRRVPTGPPVPVWRRALHLSRYVLTAGLGGALGLVLGAVLGVALGSILVGGLMGGLGVAAAGFVAEQVAGPIPDRAAAQRFGLVLGVTSGLLALPLGLLVLAAVLVANQGMDGLVFLRGLMQVKFTYGLLGTVVGTAVGTLAGAVLGYYLGRTGYRLGRRGALLGAAVAWSVAAGLAGSFAGDYAGQIIGVDRMPAARLGVVVQILVGALLLALVRPALGRLRWWWVRRP
jgi:hypothetical protein